MYFSSCIPIIFTFLNAAFVQTNFVCEDLSQHENYDLLANQDCGRTFVNNNDANHLKEQISDRIKSGTEVEFGEFPWMVLIRGVSIYGTYVCGGTLINSVYVLTAAHCVDDRTTYSFTVHLRAHNLNPNPNCTSEEKCHPEITIKPKKSKEHEKFKVERTGIVANDIALIRLDKPVEFTEYIQPICLPLSCDLRKRDFVNETMVVAGWGILSTDHKSEVLNKLNVTVREKKTFLYEPRNLSIPINHQAQISAGREDGGDTCNGDSGGPLLYQEPKNHRYYQTGIVSAGNPCEIGKSYDHYGLYTRVSHYMAWILDNIKP